MKILTTTILLAFITSANAEYRVYQYIVKNNIEHIDSPKNNLITSTLDPTSYLAYNGGNTLVSVDLLRTWMCPGNTGLRQATCESPYKKLNKDLAQEILK
jgi:hypothetical protein